MRKVFKKSLIIIISFMLGIVTLFAIAGCNTGTDELQSKIDALQNQLEEMNDRLAELEEQLEQLEKELAGKSQNEPVGSFYTLQEVYDNSWLTQEDLQVIANYHNNGIPYPESLSENVAKSIKITWADQIKDITEEDVAIIKYYGTYNGCVAVIIDKIDVNYPEMYSPVTIEIGNVPFTFTLYGQQIVLWKK